jgi:NAD(P)-dependent dehydrogenase (short-subunit alcohol dehydrogenase family)
VAANDLDVPEETLEELKRAGADTLSVPGDVSNEGVVRGMVAAVKGEFRRVDVLVNNAGISLITPAEETSLADWRRVLEVNLTGPFLTSREFGREMLRRGSGSIVNVSSVAGLLGVADRAAYNASKHGLVGLTRTLAAEWGGRGVRVNAVCPGWVKTEMDRSVSVYQN